ncbi:MAG: hypothetical protein GY805_22380 [Chloroflexi bacterium]|nr:hypothetical protein [Chloroflexota bacterium]
MINIKQNRILPQIVRRLFSPPYLPRKIVGLSLLIIITEACLGLISQPSEYWVDYSLAQMSPEWIRQILAIHPLLYLGVIFLVVILVGLLLGGLFKTPALILWTSVSFIYLHKVLGWVTVELIVPLTLTIDVKNILSATAAIIAIGFVGWIFVRILFVTPDTSDYASHRRFKSIVMGGVGIWAFLLIFGVVRAINAPVSGWFLIGSEHSPTSRVGGEIAYDSSRGKALLFGGSGVWIGGEWQYDNETWEWNGLDWIQHFPENAPPGRGGLGMAYDAGENVIVLFGGRVQNVFFDDTWEWNGETWHKLNPANKPSAREGHEMIYDPRRGQVVLYGGHDELGNFLNDAWAWDGKTWNPIPLETTSPQASNFVMVYDQSLDYPVAFLSGYPEGIWLWLDGRWHKPDLNGTVPSSRSSVGSAYDLANEQLIIFGGTQGGEIVDETWLFDGLRWQKNDLLFSASPRWGHAAFYDETRQKVMIFGGFDGENYLNDTWELVLFPQD